MTQEEYRQVVKRINEKIEYIQQGNQKVWEELQPDVEHFSSLVQKEGSEGIMLRTRKRW